MKALFKVCFSLIFIVCLLLALVYGAARLILNNTLQESPLIEEFEKPKLADLQRIKEIAINVSEQQNRVTGDANKISLSERDINLAIGHFGPKQIDIPKDSFTRVRLENSNAIVEATVSVDSVLLPFFEQHKNLLSAWQLKFAEHFMPHAQGKWLNASIPLQAVTKEDAVAIENGALTIGGITLSQSVTDQIMSAVMQEASKQQSYTLAMQSWQNIRSLSIEDSTLHASFVIPTEGGLKVQDYRTLVLEQDEIELLDLYVNELQQFPQRGALISVLSRLFDFAKQRSTRNNNPVAENRAALLALSQLYGSEQLLAQIASSGLQNRVETPTPYTIYRRKDLAQHWVLSAGATLAASGNIAELLGVDKEISDFLGGRHISAWDLLADKAGVRLAEQATATAKSARNTQILLSRARRDSDILPDIGNDFSGSNDRFSSEELAELEELIDLYLDQHRLYRY